MLQPRGDSFNNPLRLQLVRRGVLRKSIQDINLAPFRAFIEGGQQLLQHGACDQSDVFSAGLLNFGESSNGVRDDGGVGITDEIAEDVEETTIFDHFGRDVIELSNAHSSSLSDIRVVITQGPSEGLAEVFDDAVDADAAHGADGESPNEGVGVVGVFAKGVDGEQGEVGVGLGIVDNIEVDEFLKFHIGGLNAVHNVGEEHGDVLADGHVGDDLLDGVAFFVLVLGLQLFAEFVGFPFFGRVLEEARVGATAYLADGRAGIARDLVDGAADAHDWSGGAACFCFGWGGV